MRSSEAAEEIVHDVFAQLWEQRAAWTVHDTVRRYLFGAVRNRAINEVRHRAVIGRWAKRADSRPEVSGVGAGPGPVHDQAHEHQLERAVFQALNRLPARRRQAFLLRWRHEMTYPQIAAAMGISTKGVEGLLARALKAIRAEIAPLVR